MISLKLVIEAKKRSAETGLNNAELELNWRHDSTLQLLVTRRTAHV